MFDTYTLGDANGLLQYKCFLDHMHDGNNVLTNSDLKHNCSYQCFVLYFSYIGVNDFFSSSPLTFVYSVNLLFADKQIISFELRS